MIPAQTLTITYAPTFIRMYKRLDSSLKEEVRDKIVLFRDPSNHQKLKVHKLTGSLRHCFSFSINYKVRVVFKYDEMDKCVTNLLYVGSHDEVYIIRDETSASRKKTGQIA